MEKIKLQAEELKFQYNQQGRKMKYIIFTLLFFQYAGSAYCQKFNLYLADSLINSQHIDEIGLPHYEFSHIIHDGEYIFFYDSLKTRKRKSLSR